MPTVKKNVRKTLVSGGPILVLDGKTPEQEALVFGNGQILGVGSLDEMRSLAGREAHQINLDGATLMPGIIDSHPHAMHFTAFELGFVDLKDAKCHDDIVERIKERALVTPPGEWIVCSPVGEPHYYIRRSFRDLEERCLPDRNVLDRATTEHPVVIISMAPKTPNFAAMNSLALKECCIGSYVPDRICSIEIMKDDWGVPTGILRGPTHLYYTRDPYWALIVSKFPPPPEDVWEMAGRGAMMIYNALGVTSMYESHIMAPEHILGYQKIRASNESTIRVLATLEVMDCSTVPPQDMSLEELHQMLELGHSLTDVSDDWMRINGVTFGLDGPSWAGFMRMYEPYMGPDGKPTRGKTLVPIEYQEYIVKYCAENDLRLNMVMGAYPDHDDFLRLMDKVADRYDIKNKDWVVQHNVLINEAQAKRYKELEFQMTTSLSFTFGKGDRYGERLGKHVWKDLIPLKRLLSYGLNVGCGTDWGPVNHFEQMKLAQTHEFAGSGYRNNTPDHAVTREEALLGFTKYPARVMQWDNIGSLLPGYHSDMIIVDRNPMTCDLEEMEKTKVLKTIVGGETVYETGDL